MVVVKNIRSGISGRRAVGTALNKTTGLVGKGVNYVRKKQQQQIKEKVEPLKQKKKELFGKKREVKSKIKKLEGYKYRDLLDKAKVERRQGLDSGKTEREQLRLAKSKEATKRAKLLTKRSSERTKREAKRTREDWQRYLMPKTLDNKVQVQPRKKKEKPEMQELMDSIPTKILID